MDAEAKRAKFEGTDPEEVVKLREEVAT